MLGKQRGRAPQRSGSGFTGSNLVHCSAKSADLLRTATTGQTNAIVVDQWRRSRPKRNARYEREATLSIVAASGFVRNEQVRRPSAIPMPIPHIGRHSETAETTAALPC